jgi:hypothetical protein
MKKMKKHKFKKNGICFENKIKWKYYFFKNFNCREVPPPTQGLGQG